MANTSRIAGLTPVGHLRGSKYGWAVQTYCIPSTDGNAFAIGDPVTLAGSADSNGVPTITLATAGVGNLVLGAIVSGAGATAYGGMVGVPQESAIVIPATKTRAYYVMVCDDPDVIFEAQEDGVGGNLAAADVGLNVDLISGTNNGYVSGWLLDSSSKAAGATLQCKLLRLVQRSDNAFGTSAKWWVKINNHQFSAGVAGV